MNPLLQRLRRRAREVRCATTDDCYVENLCLLAEDGRAGEMKTILAKKCNVNMRDCTGQTPLHVAVAFGKANVVKLLLENGADASMVDSTGRVPEETAGEVAHVFKKKEVLKLLQASSSSPCHASKHRCFMGDMGDDEAKHITDYGTSRISTIQEAHICDHEQSTPQDSTDDHDITDSTIFGGGRNICNWTKDSMGLILVMVGLPGRGKTYIARRLCRWLNWKGTMCKIFNVGKYRREITKEASEQDSKYFDPNDPRAAAEREMLASLASEDLQRFVKDNPGAVAIFDATNSTIDRRARLVAQFSEVMESERVIFIESVCTDEEVIHNNILRAKTGNDDYRGREASYVIEDFKARIRQYEKAYQPLSTDRDVERSWVQLRNTINSHQGGHITINNVSGHLPTKLLYFLFNLRTTVCPLYLARTEDVCESPGYAASLRRFFSTRLSSETTEMRVWAANDVKAKSTIRYFTEPSFHVRHYDSMRDIDRGDCRGMSDSGFKQQYPDLYREMKTSEYSYAWPRGESYHDMNVRLEQIILDIHGSELPVLIVAGHEVLQGLYAYLAEFLPEFCIYLDVPEKSVLEFAYKSHNVRLLSHDLAEWCEEAAQGDEDCFARGFPTEQPVVAEMTPDDVLPEYLKSSATAVAVAAGDTCPLPALDPVLRSKPVDIVKQYNSNDEIVSC